MAQIFRVERTKNFTVMSNHRLSGASVILSGIVKQCQICRKCRKFVVKK